MRVKDTQMLAGKFADNGLPNEDFHPGSGHTEEICIAVSPPPREAPFGAEKNWVTIEDFHPGCDVPKKFVTRILPRLGSSGTPWIREFLSVEVLLPSSPNAR